MGVKDLNEKPKNEKKMQKRDKHLTFWVVTLFLIFSILVIILLYNFPKEQSEDKSTVPTMSINVEPYINRAACVDWILKHSSKISVSTAIGIFEEAMHTNHGFLLLALASRESSFNPTAVSKKGAIGLNQIMPNIWVEELKKNKIIKEKRDLFNYKANLKASHYILLKYYKETGLWEKALEKYVGANSESYTKEVLANCGELYLLSKSK